MGNLSNPSINRWGTNMFWYHMWYTDKNSYFAAHMDLCLEKLVYIYTFFGLYFKKHFFLRMRWNSEFYSVIKKYKKLHELKTFRFLEYRDKIFNRVYAHKARKKKKNIYVSRLWILKYQKWIVLNLYMFQPFKNKRRRRKKISARSGFSLSLLQKKKDQKFLFKYVLLNLYYYNNFFSPSMYYKF